ncbi:sensor histidine kinase [Paenibacillus sacheonensis]|uniref:histidine kinase n=1 Tax=Paenibacillus sacheonensis TaxID=742054 RepID=A0A7X5C4Q8_9BACL|nr:HAMP domain-containing sensor histidine kinase [Paenibacillus sacheonensis]MBM7568995.1 two-component system sensor histidine kinase VanS [Paenibacillus sacheonensis]NBC72634.1 HAMP domain-containing protein [Paenibacillus sacheonensis]
MIRRRGIRFKIFLVTTALLVVSSLLIYLTLYFMLPGYYKTIKQSRLESGMSELVHGVDGLPAEQALPLIAQFGQEHNAAMMLRDKDGGGYYIPPNFRSFKGWLSEGAAAGDYPLLRKQMETGRFVDGRDGALVRGMSKAGGNQRDILSSERKISFAESDESFTLYVDAPLQPIGEAAGVILLFLPYMLIPILLIAIGGAFIYARLIARPLLSLNGVAHRLARLDFTATEPALKSRDELGELSLSLSKLAVNLQSTMGELQGANAQLKSDIEREREQEAKRREFVATISHELKTPITAVSGQLEAMIGNVGPFRDRDTYLRKSYTIMQDMDKLVHEILELSKLESRDFRPLMRKVDLTELVREAMNNMSYLAGVKHMELACELPEEAMIVADERLIAKAVSNIITNAVQYSGDGERVYVRLAEERLGNEGAERIGLVPERASVGTGAAFDGSEPDGVTYTGVKPAGRDGGLAADEGMEEPLLRYRLEVLNTGVQLDESKLPRLFEPFFREEQSRSRSTGGSGLGLYIVSKVLDAHGAKYRIGNTPEGVRFSVLLRGAA